MNTMKLVAMLALAALLLSACGGGGGLAPAMPETPAAVPVVVAEPEGEAEPAREPEPVAAPVAVPEPLPDPATLLQSHDRLSLPDGFNAVLADEAMYLLANIPHRASAAGGGAGLAAASLALQVGAYALYTAERSEAYSPDYAKIEGHRGEEVVQVHPELVTGRGTRGGGGFCRPARGECYMGYPETPGNHFGDYGPSSQAVTTRIEDLPFVSGAMRDRSEGVRSRGGIDLRYWAIGNRNVPWLRYLQRPDDDVSESWSGYGAWQAWSGFGLVMQTHDHVWDLYDGAWYYSVAGGDLTRSLPSSEIEGTMRGAAVAQTEDFGIIADGAVELTVRLGASPSVDISIGSWQGYELTGGEIGQPTAVSIPDIDISNMPINADGTFWGRRLEGESFVSPSPDFSPRG